MSNNFTHALGPGSLVFGATGQEFALECTAVAVEPETEDGETLNLLSGRTDNDGDQHTANLTGTTVQDFTATGFIDYTWRLRGQVVPVVFIPNNALTRGVTGEVRIKPIALGGDVKKKNTSDFELPFVDFPELGDVTLPTDPYGTADAGADDPAPEPVG